eukprot:TRINITY_DN29256_c0_g1_i2.p1 TRINITY_DN29256_c0_g1~~TRINITY_DN29256_c0_g1_i2.p1  ORF type:complete len:194 (+),score=28.54 TRINITY_DN29256_c0_g1_i2:139-720(+)
MIGRVNLILQIVLLCLLIPLTICNQSLQDININGQGTCLVHETYVKPEEVVLPRRDSLAGKLALDEAVTFQYEITNELEMLLGFTFKSFVSNSAIWRVPMTELGGYDIITVELIENIITSEDFINEWVQLLDGHIQSKTRALPLVVCNFDKTSYMVTIKKGDEGANSSHTTRNDLDLMRPCLLYTSPSPRDQA